MLEICSIASGSNGNCYYIGNSEDALLVDAGISAKQIVERLRMRELDVNKVRAVFITHEHSDHMRGARVLAKKLNLPVYLTSRTYEKSYKNMRPQYPRYFSVDEVVTIGGFSIYPVPKLHDASDPCSFRVEYKGINVGVFTDIGEVCHNVASHLSQCDGLFLEANYDEKMLREGKYPYFLKRRVASSKGHLSNDQAYDVLENHAGPNLKYVLLSHISKDNNTHEKVMEKMLPLSDRFELKLTSRFDAGEVIRL